AEACALADGTVDVAVAAQAAHWFDLPAYYAEVWRVGRPGGVVALVSYGLVRVDHVVDPVIDRFYSQVLGPYWPPERRHVDDGYRSLPFPFEEIQVPGLAMRASWTRSDLIGYVETWSAVWGLDRAAGWGLAKPGLTVALASRGRGSTSSNSAAPSARSRLTRASRNGSMNGASRSVTAKTRDGVVASMTLPSERAMPAPPCATPTARRS